MECIVLAGGLGTRLQSMVSDVPKCMAPIDGKPFLHYLLSYLERQMTDHVIFSLGHKSETVIDWLRGKAFTFKTSWTIEKEPMGTGGGIRMALSKSREDQVFVLNGDTFFDVDLRAMRSVPMGDGSKARIALKPLAGFDRYGSVDVDAKGQILRFEEKRFCEKGLINGGVYLLDKGRAALSGYPDKFSFENDFLAKEAGKSLEAFVSDGYFIDIGVPEDFMRAQKELSTHF